MTLREMKARMGSAELHLWAAYVERNGPLGLQLRIDAAIARAVAPFMRNTKPRDLMPWPKEIEEEATPEKLFAMLKSAAANNRKH